jgi:putative spermidine/putrescine transport system ATP-binding protein
VRDVAYIGALTKYIVALDPGGELLVFQQNLTTSSMEALQVKGRPVRLIWSRSNNRPVQTGGRGEGAGAEGSQAPEEGEA